jgi:receptor protein-tyrosine kinase
MRALKRLAGLWPRSTAGSFALRRDRVSAHAFESLLGGLGLAAAEHPMRTLLVTSTQPLEGKSTVALNLGIAAAWFGRLRVLLVDGDLRHPILSERFGRLGDVGLADLLQGRATAADVIQPAGKLEADTNLSFMPAGRGGAGFVATLDRERARSTVRDAGAGFDITLIDTPPVLAVKDAAILAGAADGVLLIVGAGEVSDRSAALAKERLEQSGTPLVGAVLNRFVPSEHGLASHPYPDYWIAAREPYTNGGHGPSSKKGDA